MGGREVGTPCERTERDETVSARWTAYPFGRKLGMRPHLHAGCARKGQEEHDVAREHSLIEGVSRPV